MKRDVWQECNKKIAAAIAEYRQNVKVVGRLVAKQECWRRVAIAVDAAVAAEQEEK